MEYDFLFYLDDTFAFTPEEYSIIGVNWRTGEPAVGDSPMLNKKRFTLPTVIDGYLYFKTGDDEQNKMELKPGSQMEKVNDEEFELYTSNFNSENTFYVKEDLSDDEVTLTAVDKETKKELWNTDLDIGSIAYVKELEDYVLVDGGTDFVFYVIDRDTGEILYVEDDTYYADGVQVGNKIYTINGVGGGSADYTFHAINTDEWQSEELVTIEDIDYDYDSNDRLEYVDGILSYHLTYGFFSIDVENKEPDIAVIRHTGDEVFDKEDIDTIIHDGKYFVLSSEGNETGYGTLSIIDIKSGEVLKQYAYNHSSDPKNESFKKLDDETFIIATDNGITEFKFSDLY